MRQGKSLRWWWQVYADTVQPREASSTGGGEQGEISFTAQAQGMDQISVDVNVDLKATDEAMANRRAKTWGQLRAAYDKLAEQQAAQIKTAKFNASLGTAGRNPAADLAVMRDEVKKMCIEIMTDQHFDDFGAIDSVPVELESGAVNVSQVNNVRAWWQGP